MFKVFDRLKRFFQTDLLPDSDASLPTRETAWADTSYIYSGVDFPRYNPDSLIGRKGFTIYKEMMLDEQVKAVVRFKRDAITSRDYFFQLDWEEKGITEEEADFRIALFNQIVQNVKGSFLDALNASMSALYNGFSMVEKVYHLIDFEGSQYWGIKRLPLRPYDTFYFYLNEHGNLIKLIQEVVGNEKKLDINKFIHFVVNPDVDDWYGQSELREAYRDYFSKDIIIKFRNIWLERHAGGFRWIQPKDGKTLAAGSNEYAQLKAVMENIQAGSTAILPSTVDLNVDYPVNQAGFRDAIVDSNLGIAKALLVPNLLGITEAGQTGSYSQSETQLDAFLWTLDAAATRLEEVYNEQLFEILGEVNFGDGAYPRFKFKPVSERKKLQIIKTWTELVSKKAVTATDTDEEHLRDLLEFPVAGEPITEPQAPMLPGLTDNPTEEPEDVEEEPEQPEGIEEELGKEKQDETIIGNSLIVVSAFDRALKRVDFTVIANKSDAVTDTTTEAAGKIMAIIAKDATIWIRTNDVLDNPEMISKYKVETAQKSKLKRVTSTGLKGGWRIGQRHAETEVDRAMGEAFSIRHNKERMTFIGDEYFDLRSFAIAGNFTDRATQIIRNILINAARTDKTVGEVETEIYRTFASEGLIDEEEAKEALGAAFPETVKNPTANLRTVIRTSIFESINEARWNYFTDPGLGGFVEAMEYSAILDERTTQICQELDGHIHDKDSEIWTNYRPPNHHNCRSVLVPVTRNDTWTESDQPDLQPQKGFN